MSKATYKISGMDCMGCVKSITRSIKGFAPEAEVNVELESGLVTVDGAISADQIEAAAKQSGFTFEGQQQA